MKYRTLGDTGLKVSEVGLGCWAFGAGLWQTNDDNEVTMTIRKALDLGVNLINTADSYGDGYSEELIGKAISGRTEDVIVVSKVGKWGDSKNVPLNYDNKLSIKLCCDASLHRLKTDHIDVYLCNQNDPAKIDVFIEAFDELKEAGKIWYWGVSTNNIEVLKKFDAEGDCRVIETEYNILNRSAEKEIFPYCLKNRVGIIAKSPLALGKLTGKFSAETTLSPDDPRQVWLDEPEKYKNEIERARELSRLTHSNRTIPQAALAFALANNAVSCVIPGVTRTDQIKANVASLDYPFTPDEINLANQIFPM